MLRYIMPRDFKSFAKENEKIIKENKGKTEEYQDILNKYKNMNNNDLMRNLLNEATRLKKEGKLDSSSLNSLQSTLSPFLNNDQKDMLSNLIKTINEQK